MAASPSMLEIIDQAAHAYDLAITETIRLRDATVRVTRMLEDNLNELREARKALDISAEVLGFTQKRPELPSGSNPY